MQRPPEAAHRSRPLSPADGRETPISRSPYGAPAPISSPLAADAHIYRPGALLAMSLLGLPVLLTLGLAALALQMAHAVPIWLPVLALLGLPALPLVWLALLSARTTAIGIATGRPWRTWMELRWDEIDHVDQRGIVLRIAGVAPARESLVLAPRLLHDGARLRREILMRLPPKALSVRLGREADELLRAGPISISAAGNIEGFVEAQTRTRYWVAPTIAAIALLAVTAVALGTTAAALDASAPAIVVAVIAGGLLELLCLAIAVWLPQRLSLDAEGVTITHRVSIARRRSIAWRRMDILEYTPRLALLRIRGKHVRALCAGPRLLDAEHSAIVWSFIQSHCREHEVPLIKRHRLL